MNSLISWESRFGGHSVLHYLQALLVCVVVYFGLRVCQRILVKKLRILAEKTTTEWDDLFVDLLEHTRGSFFFVLGILSGVSSLNMAAKGESVVRSLFVISFLIQFTFWGKEIIDFAIERQLGRKRGMMPDAASQTSLNAIRFLARLMLYALTLLLILDNLGFNVTTLITGLGVGGVAVALATQNILGDLFASLSIVLDKPFVVGEFIDLGAEKGSVEKIGLKSTWIRSLSGEQIIVSNAELLKVRIRNFGRMPRRRVVCNLGFVFDTPLERLRRIPSLLKEIVDTEPKATFDRAHFQRIGDWSLNFELVYFVDSGDILDLVDAEGNIHLKMIEVFAREKIAFAFPTQTLHQASAHGAQDAL